MIKDITIGQFFPGNSILHRLDPRTKILLTVAYVVLLFVTKRLIGLAAAALFMVAVVLISRIPVKTVLKSIKPLLFIILFTATLQMIYGGGEPLFPSITWLSWLSYQGIRNAVFMAVRIVLLVTGTSFMTYTTSPIMLTGAMESLMSPLRFIKVPVHEFAMMMTIALRFIPTLIDETDKIMNAQKARGADFETGNIFRRAKALIPILVPLLISAFRRAEELADAMECRCYHGGEGRTKYKVYHFALRDLWAAMVMILLLAVIIVMNIGII